MFKTDLKEGSQSEIELPKMDLSTMESIMDFIYTGKTKITNENIERITLGANFFCVSKLLTKCVAHIKGKIDNRNAIQIFEFGNQISEERLKDFAKDYIIQNFEEISSKNLDLMEMSTGLLLEIIEDKHTSLHSDPQENAERLFQLGWNNLQSKPDDVWKTFLPKLLGTCRSLRWRR